MTEKSLTSMRKVSKGLFIILVCVWLGGGGVGGWGGGGGGGVGGGGGGGVGGVGVLWCIHSGHRKQKFAFTFHIISPHLIIHAVNTTAGKAVWIFVSGGL